MPGLLEGGRLTLIVTLATLTAASLPFLIFDDAVMAARLVIRWTARESLVLFLMTFVASALMRLSPMALTRWMRRNRRYLGLGFVVSHTVHLAAIIVFAGLSPAEFWQVTNSSMIVTGGLAYVFIYLMAATSFDGARRFLSGWPWAILHGAGTWYIWISFMVAFGKRAAVDPTYLPAMILLLAALGLKLAAWWSVRRATIQVSKA